MSKPHVLIVGAGLGGTTLAQALHQKAIPFTLFERDLDDEARFQGWAISLHQWAIDDISKSVRNDPGGLSALSTTYKLGLPAEGALFGMKEDGTVQELARFTHSENQAHIRADRAKLRKWLLHGVQAKWNKRFVSYQQNSRGVTAFFDDGTSAKGALLVGADGIGSRVRSQLLGVDVQPQHLPMGVIVGEITATKEQYGRWFAKYARSWYVGFAGDKRLFIGLKSVAEDMLTAKYYWMLSWRDQEAVRKNYWTAAASKEELHTFAMSHLNDFPEEFVEPVCCTKIEGMLHPPLLMRDMIPPDLPRGRVTLLGDAIHPMVPFRGEGGNMAMKDAIVLAGMIEKHRQVPIEDLLEEYKLEMRERASTSVLSSRANAFQ